MVELNHRYRNNQYVIESLQTICLGDLWLYAGHPEFAPVIQENVAELLDACIDYWDHTARAEEWFASKQQRFEHMDAVTIRGIDHAFFDGLRAQRNRGTRADRGNR